MGSSIFQFFSTDEILKRVAEKSATGALHVFTAKEAANLFFENGIVVGASKGLMEGSEVVHKVSEWKEARFVWLSGEPVPAGLKPVDLDLSSSSTTTKNLSNSGGDSKRMLETMLTPETRALQAVPAKSVPSLAASTGPMTMGRPRIKAEPKNETTQLQGEGGDANLVPVTSALGATKTIKSQARDDDSFEEALMRKHQLALVAVGTTPAQRLRIIRSSNLVGRNPACDFTLNHGSISRQHCLLQIMERGLHVKDLSTTNGTKVNGIPLTEGYVSVGDKLTIGHLDFVVEKDELEV